MIALKRTMIVYVYFYCSQTLFERHHSIDTSFRLFYLKIIPSVHQTIILYLVTFYLTSLLFLRLLERIAKASKSLSASFSFNSIYFYLFIYIISVQGRYTFVKHSYTHLWLRDIYCSFLCEWLLNVKLDKLSLWYFWYLLNCYIFILINSSKI